MKVQGAKVLVTGAGGFIGSHLVEALVARGAEVTAMVHYDARPDLSNLEMADSQVRSKLKVLSGNIEDPFFVSSAVAGQDIVFHLAALIAIPYSYVAPASYVRTNVEGTLNVLEAARTHKVKRVVHTSTSETYGTALHTPIDEKHPLQGQSPYSASKIGADKLAESYYLSFGLPVATIRPFNTFGPRQSARAVIPTIISQALSSSPVVKLGALSPLRDLNYVADTVEGFISVAESDQALGEVINVGSGKAISIGDLATLILKLAGVKKEIVCESERIRPEKSEVMTLLADARKAEALTGWKPRVGLEQGLLETIAFIRNHADRFRSDIYNR
ncbi:GDP-mannose 4,6-dehydratase [Archangium violaceum]|uniref:NAD-dependent dehydratase n=1 Tax=Archangium violaceum Cb vi76 TaxID=1406225 RepID=A0A084T1R1_9BACT|nr:GDP-mannose 4,6-dehydratase [Archangium violaceum]KFA94646.1 NAD-dependent dehydratase [Archangium violaceum Cb vi76]